MVEKITKWVSCIFAVLWFVTIFSEYWRNNPNYGNAIKYFQYSDLLILFLLMGGLASWKIMKAKEKPIKYINGLTVFIGLLVLDVFSLLFFYSKFESVTLHFPGLVLHLGHLVGVAFAIFSIYLASRIVGNILTFIFPLKIAKSDLPLIQAALGISAMTFLLFFLGTLGLLKVWIVGPLLLLIIITNIQETLRIVESILFRPLKLTKDLDILGIFSFLFLGAFLIFDFVQNLRPFPTGVDALNLYVNLPKLIGDYETLIAGHQPYNWSLFMSFGTVVFQRIDVALGLSFLGGFLSLGALFQLSRKWLTVNQSALCLLLFASMPMTNFLWYKDLKIDMGLLFITLCVLLLLYNWIVPPKPKNKTAIQETQKSAKQKKQPKATPKIASPKKTPAWQLYLKQFFANKIPTILKENRLLVVIGFLTGFAFGIKLTVLFFFLALGTTIWYKEGGFIAFIAAFFLSFGAVFLLELDAQPGLRNFHNNVPVLQWILIAIGLSLIAYLFLKEKKSMIRILRVSIILGVFFSLPILPWLGKNFYETRTLSVDTLLNGEKATPVVDMEELEELIK